MAFSEHEQRQLNKYEKELDADQRIARALRKHNNRTWSRRFRAGVAKMRNRGDRIDKLMVTVIVTVLIVLLCLLAPLVIASQWYDPIPQGVWLSAFIATPSIWLLWLTWWFRPNFDSWRQRRRSKASKS